MRISFPVLKQEFHFDICDAFEVMDREYGELQEALTKYRVTGRIPDRDHLAEEICDFIQGGIDMLDLLTPPMSRYIGKHWDKLQSRKWVIKDSCVIYPGEPVEEVAILEQFYQCAKEGRTPDTELMARAKRLLEVKQ